MRQLTASQKIALLERRIAKLEKEAGITEVVTGLLRRIKNIPANFIKRIFNALRDVGSSLEALVGRFFKTSHFVSTLETQLELRVQNAFYGAYSTSKKLPEIVNLDIKDPMRSVFIVWGSDNKPDEMTIPEMSDFYGGLLGKKIKVSYLSWESDFQSYLDMYNGKADPSFLKRIFNNLFESFKQTSKLFYRILKAILAVLNLTFFGLVMKLAWWDFASNLVFAYMTFGLEGLQASASKRFMSTASKFKKPLIKSAILPIALNLIESAFVKWGVNTDSFDKRTSGQYPQIRLALQTLESSYIPT